MGYTKSINFNEVWQESLTIKVINSTRVIN